MAISILDAQGRSKLVAALANIKREDLDVIDHSLSPPMSANTSINALYNNLSAPHPPLPFDITSQLIANRHAAAAYMAVHMPFTSLFPTQSAQSIFNQWAAAQAAQTQAVPQQLMQTAEPHSPPASPISPITSYLPQAHHLAPLPPVSTTTTTTTSMTSNALKHPHSSSGSPTSSLQLGETPAKKARKLSIKKDLIPRSSPVDIPLNVADLYQNAHHNGPISPPSSGSGSSPNLSQENLHILPLTVNTHTTHKESSRDKSFTCKICSRSFGYKHVLQNHERTHTGEKPFECPECHKRFTRDHHLKTHMRLHTGEKPYHCSHCDRQFVQVANLRRHLRVHTGERPYKCEVCEHNFSDSNQLKSHLLTHNNEKPFECENCHTKFRRRHLWANHRCNARPVTPSTPSLSPAISQEYIMVEPKIYTNNNTNINTNTPMTSSYSSEESMDLGRPLNVEIRTSSMQNLAVPIKAHITVETPLDLSEDFARRARADLHDIFRVPQQVLLQPEQTEPEDLSINSQRSANSSANSSMMLQEDEIETEEEDEEIAFHHERQQRSLLIPNTADNDCHADQAASPYHVHSHAMGRLGLIEMQVE